MFRPKGRSCVLYESLVSRFSCPDGEIPSEALCFRVQACAYYGCCFANVKLLAHRTTSFNAAAATAISFEEVGSGVGIHHSTSWLPRSMDRYRSDQDLCYAYCYCDGSC